MCSLPLLYIFIDHRHWFHWTAVRLQLHASLVHVSACSFAVSQASDLELEEDNVCVNDPLFDLYIYV